MQVIFIKNNTIIYKQQNKHIYCFTGLCSFGNIDAHCVKRSAMAMHLSSRVRTDRRCYIHGQSSVWCDLASFTAAVNQVD